MTALRKQALTIVGPDGASGFPDIATFLQRMFGSTGAFEGMSDLLDGRPFPLDVRTVTRLGESEVFRLDGLSISAYPVPHGKAPTLAYRIDVGKSRLAFGADQTGLDPGFPRFAAESDLLVLHAILTNAAETDKLADVAALPRDLGILAKEARVKRVVLSHLMKSTPEVGGHQVWSLDARHEVRDSVEKALGATVHLANDLECFAL
jgi:ribonuclease BN (tRNA processing enzyme)